MRVVTYGQGGHDPNRPNGNIVAEIDIPDPPPSPLHSDGVAATLNAVLGLWTIEDAANVVGLTPADLVAEAEAWAAAAKP
jgi:hypothetical protein